MDQFSRARRAIFPPLTTAETELAKAIQSNNPDYKMRQYVTQVNISNYEEVDIGSILGNEIAEVNREVTNEEANKILTSVGKRTSNRYEPKFEGLVNELSDPVIEGLSKYDVHSMPTNQIEWMMLKFTDRIRCDVIKSKNMP